jgi:hypothetical protein
VLHDAKAMPAAGYSYGHCMHMDDHITSVYLGQWKKESSGSIAAALGQVAEAPVPVHATGRCPVDPGSMCVRVSASSDMIRSICSLDFAFVMYCV